MDKSPAAFRTISEVAQDLALPQHVLRFWETRFTQIKPLKRGGGRRYYRPDDIELLRSIRHLLYADGYTIKGVQRLLREHGARAVAAAASGSDLEPAIARRAAEGQVNPSEDQADPSESQVDPSSGEAFALPQETAPPDYRESELEALFGASARPPARRAVDRAKLQTVLAELAECERLLAAARNL